MPHKTAGAALLGDAATEFSDVQYADAYPEGVEHHFWHLARNRLVASELRRALPKPGRVLEIGCGPGIVVQHLRAAGVDCWGCDLGQPIVPADCRPYAFTARDCLQLEPAFRSSVDALLLLDVLEHIDDDVAFLREVKGAFPRCRSLLVTVPARSELWSNYDDYYGHFRRHDCASLAMALTAGGFRLVRQRYFFQELYLPMLLARTTSGQRTTAVPVPSNRTLHRFLAGVSCACRTVLPAGLPGTSLLAVSAP